MRRPCGSIRARWLSITGGGAIGAAGQAAALRAAADMLIHEVGAGRVVKGDPGKEARHFLEAHGAGLRGKKQAVAACMALWEADQL